MTTCTFCGAALPEFLATYVERADVDAQRTDLARACANCAAGFPATFSVR